MVNTDAWSVSFLYLLNIDSGSKWLKVIHVAVILVHDSLILFFCLKHFVAVVASILAGQGRVEQTIKKTVVVTVVRKAVVVVGETGENRSNNDTSNNSNCRYL